MSDEMVSRSASASLTVTKQAEVPTEVFEGTTLADIFKLAIMNSTEDRDRANELYEKVNKDITDAGAFALLGENISKLIEASTKATDNIIKVAQVAQKHIDKKDSVTQTASISMEERNLLFDILEKHKIGPQRLSMVTGKKDLNEWQGFEEVPDTKKEKIREKLKVEDKEDFLKSFPNKKTRNL